MVSRSPIIASFVLLAWCLSLLTPTAQAGGKNQLLRGLRAKSFKVRLKAAIQIGKKGVASAVPALRRIADRPKEHEAVRAAALVSLAQTRDEASRKRFGYLIGHKSKLISKAAERALILLDKLRPQPPVYLIALEPPRLLKGVAKARSKPILETIQERLANTGGVVVGGGERQFLSEDKFVAHLAKRNLMGLLLKPEMATLKAEVSAGRTTILAEVRVAQFTLPGRQEEFVALGGADAWIDAERITSREKAELEDEVLRGATDSALMQVLQDLVARGAE